MLPARLLLARKFSFIRSVFMPVHGDPVARRSFLRSISLAASAPIFSIANDALAMNKDTANAAHTAVDAERMRALAAWTMKTMETPNPVPYGAEIFGTNDGKSLMRAANAVRAEHDPSAHGEIHTIRLACQKLQSASLRGYTLYTTCEPCPMCMACCLWAGLDRVVYGATIADAAKYGHQILIPAAEVAKRTDMHCVVNGPVAREACLPLFTNPTMQKVFAQWKKG
jgi:tRNA(Arg) A34 adenosine deaminase TadA